MTEYNQADDELRENGLDGAHDHHDHHDHAHDHAHEHAHDHDHDHAYGHDHGDGHHHEHSRHELMDLPKAEVGFEFHVHEQAATVSAALDVKEGESVSFAQLVTAMQDIAVKAEAAGGVVGHIKAFGRAGDSFAHASVTAAGFEPTTEGDVALALDSESEAQLVSIVLLIGLDDLFAIVKDCLSDCVR